MVSDAEKKAAVEAIKSAMDYFPYGAGEDALSALLALGWGPRGDASDEFRAGAEAMREKVDATLFAEGEHRSRCGFRPVIAVADAQKLIRALPLPDANAAPFTESDRFEITGRGTVVTGPCPAEWDGLEPGDVVGRPVIVGGQRYRVAGLEHHLVPGPLCEGQPVGVLLGERGEK